MSHTTKPFPITPAEWREILEVAHVREAWGLDERESAEDFSKMVYGAKFDFVSDGPGPDGELFILHGDMLSAPPMVLLRGEDRSLSSVYDWRQINSL